MPGESIRLQISDFRLVPALADGERRSAGVAAPRVPRGNAKLALLASYLHIVVLPSRPRGSGFQIPRINTILTAIHLRVGPHLPISGLEVGLSETSRAARSAGGGGRVLHAAKGSTDASQNPIARTSEATPKQTISPSCQTCARRIRSWQALRKP